MKYIFFSFTGLAYPVAFQFVKEGQQVVVGVVEDIKDYVMEEDASKSHEDEYSKSRRLDVKSLLI